MLSTCSVTCPSESVISIDLRLFMTRRSRHSDGFGAGERNAGSATGLQTRQRLGDEDGEIRAEAILGLDPRALAQLKHELRHWPEWDLCFEAAAHLRSPELYPLLQALLKEYPEEEAALGPAMEACRPSSPELR
jgi:hypothetical protein